MNDETTNPPARSAMDPASLTDPRSLPVAAMPDRIFAAAQPGAVFSPPVTAGAYTVITASQVMSGGGFGSGMGFGPAPSGAVGATGEAASGQQPSGGGGGGGGGGASGRPVAVIVIGPDGVQVKPVVDPTQIAIAAITAWATMAGIFRRMRRGRRS